MANNYKDKSTSLTVLYCAVLTRGRILLGLRARNSLTFFVAENHFLTLLKLFTLMMAVVIFLYLARSLPTYGSFFLSFLFLPCNHP